MNNLSSYCEAKIRASDKDLPVPIINNDKLPSKLTKMVLQGQFCELVFALISSE